MVYNQGNAPAALIAIAMHLLGTPYSEQFPEGSEADGHDWELGEPYPDAMDCSGEVVVLNVSIGIPNFNRGSAQNQLDDARARGWMIPDSEDLQPVDTGCFMGIENTPGYAGHTATVLDYDPTTRTGHIIGEYDTQKGSCILPFDRDQLGNGDNGLGVVGFYRQIRALSPAPVPTPTEDTDMNPVITKDPNNGGMIILDTAAGTYNGIADPATASWLENVCKIPVVASPSVPVFAKFKQVGTI